MLGGSTLWNGILLGKIAVLAGLDLTDQYSVLASALEVRRNRFEPAIHGRTVTNRQRLNTIHGFTHRLVLPSGPPFRPFLAKSAFLLYPYLQRALFLRCQMFLAISEWLLVSGIEDHSRFDQIEWQGKSVGILDLPKNSPGIVDQIK